MSEIEVLGLGAIAIFSFWLSYYGSTVGLVLGQLRVVLLTYLLGSASLGSATSLAVSTVATIAGATVHARSGRVKVHLLLTVGLPSAVAAFFASKHAAHLDPRVLKSAIAAALIVTGTLMLRADARQQNSESAPPKTPKHATIEQVALGATLGTFSGLVGLLLGTIRLPVMLRISGVRPEHAVGSNMAIGALTGLSGGLGAVAEGRIHWPSFVVLAPLTLLGAHMGAERTGKVDARTLKRWIAYALIASALMMLAEVVFLVWMGPKRSWS